MGEKGYNSAAGPNLERKKQYSRMAKKCSFFLRDKYHVKKVYMIGSLAKGVFHDRSDIDLVVVGLPAEYYITALTELYDILLPGMELNLIPFEDAFDSLKEKALKEGRLLYG